LRRGVAVDAFVVIVVDVEVSALFFLFAIVVSSGF